MADNLSSEARSEQMRRVVSKGNRSTEMKLMEIFRSNRILGWRRNQKQIGKPDFVFRRERVCVFVDGCFWHGCPMCYRAPRSNLPYWQGKIKRNHARDRHVTRSLKGLGWRVARVWEHELAAKRRSRLLSRLARYGLKTSGL
jgi:DNA mismatch endonuclease (patch repair protein)